MEEQKKQLKQDLANYIGSEGDHNTREVVEKVMVIVDEFKWWVEEWHKNIMNKF